MSLSSNFKVHLNEMKIRMHIWMQNQKIIQTGLNQGCINGSKNIFIGCVGKLSYSQTLCGGKGEGFLPSKFYYSL